MAAMRVLPEWDRPRPMQGQASSYYPPLVFPNLLEEMPPKPALASFGGGMWGGRAADPVSSFVRPPRVASPARIEPARPSAASSFLPYGRAAEPASPAKTFPSWPEGSGRLPASPLQERPQPERPQQEFDLQVPSTGSRGRSEGAPVAAVPSDQEVEVRSPNGDAPTPWRTWQDVLFSNRLLSPLIAAGFPSPSLIQQHAWAIATRGNDLIGIAKTGSGKTLAFLLPAFSRLLEKAQDSRAPPAILVLAPTRELACQIFAEANKFGASAGFRAVCLYGGTPKGPQLAELRSRPQLIVATPGRLNDLLDPPPGMSLGVDVKSIQFLVLDEADRMLDMGFEPQIRKIINCIPPERQTMMFTATWPASVRRLAEDFLKEPCEIRVGETEKLTVNADIEQHVVFVTDEMDRKDHLDRLLRESGDDQVIVFCATKRGCDSLSFRIPGSISIHGDKDQQQRDAALHAFKSGSKRVLVATDVAARGLDIKSVRVVINYEPPNNSEDYVHRVGRTGRAGLKGKAFAFVSNEDGNAARFIAEVMKTGGVPIPAELERRLASGEMRFGGGGGGGGGGRARSQSRGPRRGMFGDDDDFGRDNFGDMGGSSRFGGMGGGGMGGGFGGRRENNNFSNSCPNDCPT